MRNLGSSAIVVGVVVLVAANDVVDAQPWQDATASCLPATAEWTNRVELADLDRDGELDIVLANGGNVDATGTPEPVRAWRNLGAWGTAGTHCTELTGELGLTGLSRVVRTVDVDGDGDLDLLSGGAFQTQLRLLVRGAGGWTDGTSKLPQQPTSIADLDAGDVDGDGDLDLVLAEWGTATPAIGPGGRTRLYLNDGTGTYSDATASHMPAVLVKWALDVDLVDLDRDWDLDAVIACSACAASRMFINDGNGMFVDLTGAWPAVTAQELEPVDLDGDFDLDLVAVDTGTDLRERLYENVSGGVIAFVDQTSFALSASVNPANSDDSSVLGIDTNSDGIAELLLGGLGSDRLLTRAGNGTYGSTTATPGDTPATLGLAAGDVDGDGRLDLVHAQGNPASADKLQLGSAAIAVDAVPPRVLVEERYGQRVDGKLHAIVDDVQWPVHVDQFTRVWLEHDGARLAFETPPHMVQTDLRWAGGDVWISPHLTYVSNYRACARDRRGNEGCSPWVYVYNVRSEVPSGTHDGGFDDNPDDDWRPRGGCCDSSRTPAGSLLLALACLARLHRRRD